MLPDLSILNDEFRVEPSEQKEASSLEIALAVFLAVAVILGLQVLGMVL